MGKTILNIAINPALLMTVCGVSGDGQAKVVMQIYDWATACIECPPNITRFVSGGKQVAAENKVWIYRGYYPNTNVFFKLSVIAFDDSYYAKFQPVIPNNKGMLKVDDHMMDRIGDAMLLNEDMDFGVKAPRCMAPRGMPLLGRLNE